MTPPSFKYADGAWASRTAIAYATAGHAGAIALLCAWPWPLRLAGLLLAAHTLVIAAYLTHECIHESVFREQRWNARLGSLLAWLCGGAPAGYERLRRKHLHHHLDRVDPIACDYRALLARHAPLRWAVVAFEWLHVPALELLLRAVSIVRPFRNRAFAGERRRVAAAVASRAAFAALLAALGWSVLALYVVAYLLFVVAARLGDAFHHTFELIVVPDYGLDFGPPPGKDRLYEQANTFTNPLSMRWPVLNALVLNFVFHNAHHEKPGIPWHRLPALDRRLYGDDARQAVPLRRLLGDFHRHRVARLSDDGPGAVGVSLLTL